MDKCQYCGEIPEEDGVCYTNNGEVCNVTEVPDERDYDNDVKQARMEEAGEI